MDNNLTMEELLKQQEEEYNKVRVGQIVTGTINKVGYNEVVVLLNYRFDGVIPMNEFSKEEVENIDNLYKEGDQISAVVTNISDRDSVVYLSKIQVDRREHMKEVRKAFENHEIMTVHVEKNIEKGIFATYKSVTLFMPISQIDVKFVNDTSKYVGRSLEVYITELDEKKNKLVVSHREVLNERIKAEKEVERTRIKAEREAEKLRVKEEREAEKLRIKTEKENLFNSLAVGQRRDGKVTKIMEYGAFVDLGGVEGLVHINNLAWTRVENVEDLVKVGDEVEVFVISVDSETKRIGLALKDIENDPWNKVKEIMQVDDVITGKVVRTIEKGAFVEVAEAVEAFLPISELSDDRVVRVTNVVNPGDEITVKIIELRPKNRRMVVSLKEATREPEEDYTPYLKNDEDESMGTLGDLFKDKFKNLKF